MNQDVALIAEQHVADQEAATMASLARCSLLPAILAVMMQRFHSNLGWVNQSTVASVSQLREALFNYR